MFKESLEAEAQDRTYLQLATVYTMQGRLDDAIATYITALAQSPDNPELLTQLGLLYLRTSTPPLASNCNVTTQVACLPLRPTPQACMQVKVTLRYSLSPSPSRLNPQRQRRFWPWAAFFRIDKIWTAPCSSIVPPPSQTRTPLRCVLAASPDSSHVP